MRYNPCPSMIGQDGTRKGRFGFHRTLIVLDDRIESVAEKTGILWRRRLSGEGLNGCPDVYKTVE